MKYLTVSPDHRRQTLTHTELIYI